MVGWEEDANELFFCGVVSVLVGDKLGEGRGGIENRRGGTEDRRWTEGRAGEEEDCSTLKARRTINLSPGSTIFLPDEGYAHDNHDNAVDYRGDDWRGPDIGLAGLGRHGAPFWLDQ